MPSLVSCQIRIAVAAAALGATAFPAAAAQPQLSVPDTAWMMMATALVMVMIMPGIALFYGGLVRSKNTVSMLAQVAGVLCVVSGLWLAYGYSVAFTSSSWVSFFGGISKAFLTGVKPSTIAATHANGIGVPEYAVFGFQLMFAALTTALIVGSLAERMRFAACLMFAALWLTFVYVPIAHMTWFAPTPDQIGDAARAVLSAAPGPSRRQAEAVLAGVYADAGLFAQWGAIDFAGGIVVHVNAGIAGLIGALALGRRTGYGQDSMAPHNLALMTIGGALLWVGWIGFNAGSAMRADGVAALAMLNTVLAGAAGAIAWIAIEMTAGRKPSLIGMMSGVLAGLVAVTPGAGYVAPLAGFGIGIAASIACYWACTYLKARYGFDDALDVFGIHCVAGVLGTLAVGVLAAPELGGTGILDYAASPGTAVVGSYDIAGQLKAQVAALAVTLAWSAYVTYRIFHFVDTTIGLRPTAEEEAAGLDAVDHGERAYN